MPARDSLRAQGTITEVLCDGAYRVELANGHGCVGRASVEAPPLARGDKVTLEFHPYDLSRARIVPETA
jgi:translation initiation factor IF-1